MDHGKHKMPNGKMMTDKEMRDKMAMMKANKILKKGKKKKGY